MPYIKPALRAYFTGIEKEIERVNIQDAGAFNYLVHLLIHKSILSQGVSYATFNALIGAMDCAKMELYARLIRAYENEKIVENGDVHPYLVEPGDHVAPGIEPAIIE